MQPFNSMQPRKPNRQRGKALALLAVLTCLLGFVVAAYADDTDVFLPLVATASTNQDNSFHATTTPTGILSEADKTIQLVTAIPVVAEFLQNYPDWRGESYPEGDDPALWKVDFYDKHENGEWIGFGRVNLQSEEVLEYFVPRELPTEEFQAGQQKIEAYLKYDVEIQTRLGNPDLWYHDVSWDRWEQAFAVYYSWGLEAFVVQIKIDAETGQVNVQKIYDPNELEAAKEAERRRNQAVELAWTAEGIGEALDGHDNWRTYVEPIGGGHYTVEFANVNQLLFSVLVDADAETVIEAGK